MDTCKIETEGKSQNSSRDTRTVTKAERRGQIQRKETDAERQVQRIETNRIKQMLKDIEGGYQTDAWIQ